MSKTVSLVAAVIVAGIALALTPTVAQPPRTKPTQVLKPAPKLGEVRIRLLGLTTEQIASNISMTFQLFQSEIPVFPTWQVTYSTPQNMGRHGDISWYSEGDTFYLRGLRAGVYDLHFKGAGATYAYADLLGTRPVHIYGIVVEAGKPVILEDLRFEKGQTVVKIGKPTILPDPAVNIVDKFNELSQRVEELTLRVQKLENENAELRKKLTKP